METTLGSLFQMEGQSLLPSSSMERSPPAQTRVESKPVPFPASSIQQHSAGRRGTRVTLPPDFLRLPREEPPMTTSLLTPGSPEYLTLFSDPAFLAEMEREFGPDFEAVLREHVQAEALRNTSNYSSYISGQPENSSSHTSPAVPQQNSSANQNNTSIVSQSNQNLSTQQPLQSLKPMEGMLSLS